MIKAVIHLHSKHSFDCLTNPNDIVDKAVAKGISILAITDHDTIEGSVAAKKYAEKKYGNKIHIITGAEFNSDYGDIIALNISENILEKNPTLLIQRIKYLGGLVLLPHPYYHHKEVEELAIQCDMIEIFNGRINEEMNKKAADLALRLKKPVYVASDAHFLSDGFLCINKYNSNLNLANLNQILLNADRSFDTGYSKKKNIHKSQMIKGIKTKNGRLILSSIKECLKDCIRKGKT